MSSENDGYYIVISAYTDTQKFISDYKTLSKANLICFGEEHIKFRQKTYYLYYSERFTDRESAEAVLPEIQKKAGEIIAISDFLFIKPEPVVPMSMKELIKDERTDFGTEFIFRKPEPGYPYKIIAEKKGAQIRLINKKPGNIISLKIIDAIPQSGSIPAGAPVIVFFNGEIYLPSIIKNIHLKSGKNIIPGIIRVFNYTDGKSAISITPEDINRSGNLSLVISGKVTNQYRNKVKNPLTLDFSYLKGHSASQNRVFFETPNSITSAGDVKILKGKACGMPASEGENFLAISNSDKIVSEKKSIAGKSGYYSLFCNRSNKVKFSYNFLSGEFNEYASNPYGDIALVIATSKDYQKSWIISSVYSTGTYNINLRYKAFCGLPDKGDSHTGMTGWKEFIKDTDPLEGPVVLTFIITDIADPEFSSVLLLDRIELN